MQKLREINFRELDYNVNWFHEIYSSTGKDISRKRFTKMYNVCCKRFHVKTKFQKNR